MAKEEEDDILILKPYKSKQASKQASKPRGRVTAVTEISVADEFRRCHGQLQLLETYGMGKPQKGKSIHVISGGNVDLIAFVKWLLLHFPHIRRMFLSAWCISAADICLLKRWLDNKQIDEADVLVGDVFPTNYHMEYQKLCEMYNERKIRNLYVSTIHSKLILLDVSDDVKIVVESSANCNMNPRVEQSVVTMSDELYKFYDDYFHELFEEEKLADAVRDLVKLELKTEIDDEEGDILQGE